MLPVSVCMGAGSLRLVKDFVFLRAAGAIVPDFPLRSRRHGALRKENYLQLSNGASLAHFRRGMKVLFREQLFTRGAVSIKYALMSDLDMVG